MAESERELGIQPLDAVMAGLQLNNADLVSASSEQLTHKNVQKGRKGRRLSLTIQMKIVRALNLKSTEKKFSRADLFNY